MRLVLLITIACIYFLLSSCNTGFEPIDFGRESCQHCKMTILDKRFAAELVTKKGKVYKFDDAICMKRFIDENKINSEVKSLYVANYKGMHNDVLDAKTATFLHNAFFHSPMNGNCAAFAGPADAKALEDSLGAQIVTWENLH